LRRVRAVLPELHELITEKQERDDPLALIDFFSIPKADRDRVAPRTTVGRPADLPPSKPKPFRILKRKGGFAILPEPEMDGVQFPLAIQVRCAYDILTGNPFKRFSEIDFDLFKAHRGNKRINGTISIVERNANCWPIEPNLIDIRANAPNFIVEVVGFDKNRDLVIEAQS